MKIVAVLFALVAWTTCADAYRTGIAIWQFGKMIKCATGRSAFAYNGYGCWCGRGGSGTTVDETDRCCKTHDECYGRLVNNNACRKNQWFTVTYRRRGCTGCAGAKTYCGSSLCQCDQAAVACFKRATFNSRYREYGKVRIPGVGTVNMRKNWCNRAGK